MARIAQIIIDNAGNSRLRIGTSDYELPHPDFLEPPIAIGDLIASIESSEAIPAEDHPEDHGIECESSAAAAAWRRILL